MENNRLSVNGGGRTRVLIVGTGFAGFTCARELERRLGSDDTEILLVSPTDYLLYSPLLPEVAAGAIDPRHVAVPLHGRLKRTRVVPGYAVGADLEARTLTVALPDEPADGTLGGRLGQARPGAGGRHADVSDPGPRGEGARVQDARRGAVPA